MRDGKTRRLDRQDSDQTVEGFLGARSVCLVVVEGRDVGTNYPIGQERYILGRGPGVDLMLDDQAMSRQHAAIEYDGHAFRIRDLGSTNGIAVNGQVVQVADLSSGDSIEVGSQVFHYMVEELEPEPDVYVLTTDE